MNPIAQWFQQRRVRRAKNTTEADLKGKPYLYREMRKLLGETWHPPPARILELGLILVHNPDPAVRALAIQALVESKAPGIEIHLLPAVKDPVPAMRRGAIDGLAAIRRGDFSNHLIPALQDADDAVRAAAATALAVGGAECVPHLVTALNDPVPLVRANAVSALGTLGKYADERVVDAIIQMLPREESPSSRAKAAAALSRMLESPAAGYLSDTVSKLLSQPDAPREMREVSADVLGRIARPECVAPLRVALSDPELQVRFRALESLGKLAAFADPGMADDLLRVLRAECDKDARWSAMSAMKKLRETPVAGYLAERLTGLIFHNQETEDTRVAAIFVLAHVAGAGSLPELERLSGTGPARLRSAVASGLGEIKGERSVAMLRRLAADRDAAVKDAALRSLKNHDVPLCRRCGTVADRLFGFTKEPVCLACYSKPGVCQSCGKNVGSDAALIKIGAGKNCRECNVRLDQVVSGGFRTSTRIR